MSQLLQSLRSSLSRLSLATPTSTSLCSRALSTSQPLEWHKKSWRGNGYGHHGGPWLCLYSPNDGKRESYPLAHQRFKRLDWGMYIRPRGGRAKKHWKKTAPVLWRFEQHIFCARYMVRRLDRMFAPEVKEPRHIPDDPYAKYNRLSYFDHLHKKRKNAENIRQRGNNVYRFDRWKAHLSRHPTRYNRVPCASYEPPSYVEDVAANGGVYSADEFVPEDTPAPHFERAPVMINKRSTPDSRLPSIKRLEVNYGKLVPWHPLLKSPFRKV